MVNFGDFEYSDIVFFLESYPGGWSDWNTVFVPGDPRRRVPSDRALKSDGFALFGDAVVGHGVKFRADGKPRSSSCWLTTWCSHRWFELASTCNTTRMDLQVRFFSKFFVSDKATRRFFKVNGIFYFKLIKIEFNRFWIVSWHIGSIWPKAIGYQQSDRNHSSSGLPWENSKNIKFNWKKKFLSILTDKVENFVKKSKFL